MAIMLKIRSNTASVLRQHLVVPEPHDRKAFGFKISGADFVLFNL